MNKNFIAKSVSVSFGENVHVFDVVGTTPTQNPALKTDVQVWALNFPKETQPDAIRAAFKAINTIFRENAVDAIIGADMYNGENALKAILGGVTVGGYSINANGDITADDVLCKAIKDGKNADGNPIFVQRPLFIEYGEVISRIQKVNKNAEKTGVKVHISGDFSGRDEMVMRVFYNAMIGQFRDDEKAFLEKVDLAHLIPDGKKKPENWLMQYVNYFYTVFNHVTGNNYKPVKGAFFAKDGAGVQNLILTDKRFQTVDSRTNTRIIKGGGNFAKVLPILATILCNKYVNTNVHMIEKAAAIKGRYTTDSDASHTAAEAEKANTEKPALPEASNK